MIKTGELVVYALAGKPYLGIVGSKDTQTGKYRVVPLNDVNHTSKKLESELLTLDNIEQAKKLLGKG